MDKTDIYGCSTEHPSHSLKHFTKPKYHNYILQYCWCGHDKGINDFIKNYLKEHCVLLTTIGIGGGGGVSFTTELDISELHRVLNTYNLEYVLYQLDTGFHCVKTSADNIAILNKIFGTTN